MEPNDLDKKIAELMEVSPELIYLEGRWNSLNYFLDLTQAGMPKEEALKQSKIYEEQVCKPRTQYFREKMPEEQRALEIQVRECLRTEKWVKQDKYHQFCGLPKRVTCPYVTNTYTSVIEENQGISIVHRYLCKKPYNPSA